VAGIFIPLSQRPTLIIRLAYQFDIVIGVKVSWTVKSISSNCQLTDPLQIFRGRLSWSSMHWDKCKAERIREP
jgi:hypothetical protein